MFKTLFTGIDNKSLDMGRIGFLLTLGTFLILEAFVVSKSAAFDMQAFGIGSGAIAASFGAMLKLKEGSEPKE